MRVLVLLAMVTACSGEPTRVSIGAAAVMRHAMPELIARYHQQSDARIDVMYGASDTLAIRAKTGTPLDVLVLAESAGLAGVGAGDARTIATTSLVLVGPAGAAYRFANLRDEGVVAIGDLATVPAGRYAQRYLEQIGAWESVSSRVVLGGDVAGVLALAQRGTSHVAIVYATDVADAAPLVVLDRATDGPSVRVTAAATRLSSQRAAADAFVAFLGSADAQSILQRHGFAAP